MRILVFGRLKRVGYQLIDLIDDRPALKPGAVVWRDLLIGSAEHSGIYIGDGKIVELSGDGVIREVTKSQFLNGVVLGYRTGINTFISSKFKWYYCCN